MSKLLLLCAVTMVCGCTTAHRVNSAADVAPRNAIFVRFESPRDLEATSDTLSYTLPAIETVAGRVEEIRGSSLVLRVYELGSHRRQPRLPRDARIAVVPDATARVSTRRFSPGKTLGLAVLAAIGLAALTWDLDVFENCDAAECVFLP